MIAGKIVFEIFLPYCRSLKDKRKVVKSIKDSLQSNFKISIAEVDYEDMWQRSKFIIALAGKDTHFLNSRVQKIFDFLKNNPDFEILDFKKEYF